LWNVAHLWLDAAGFLYPIKGPHHAIRDPNRTFIEVLSKVGNADKDEAALAAIGARFWCGASSAEMDLVDL
jgi:hypothetical protein